MHAGGHRVTFADPTAKDRAKRVAETVGASHEIPYRQAMRSELLVLAVPRDHIDRAVMALGSGAEAVIVDAVQDERGSGSRSGAEMLAHKLDTHRVVRALIHIPQSGSNVQICGDDENSKVLVDRAFQACGCATTDRGPLSSAVELEAPRSAA
jgi:predicted dinucleotide-binding enzyme